MSSPRVQVEKQGDGYIIRVLDRHSESDIVTKFQEVFSKVNRAALLPPGERQGPRYQTLFKEGPELFNHQAIDPDTGKSITQLGGLQVSAARLEATIAKLRELGFEVIP